MKSFKAICTTVILALALSVPAYAGDILSPGFTVPPPPPPEELNVAVEMSVTTETPSDHDAVSTADVANILWLLASMF